MPDPFDHDAADRTDRERIRELYARLLAPGPDADRTDGDPFGADLFGERVFDDAEHDVACGGGSESLHAFPAPGGDGPTGPFVSGPLTPVWALAPSPPRPSSGAAPAPDDLLGGTIFGDLDARPRARRQRASSPAAPFLRGLPECPTPGQRHVLVVPFRQMGLLNEQLDAGWRVVQLNPSDTEDAFIAVLCYAG